MLAKYRTTLHKNIGDKIDLKHIFCLFLKTTHINASVLHKGPTLPRPFNELILWEKLANSSSKSIQMCLPREVDVYGTYNGLSGASKPSSI